MKPYGYIYKITNLINNKVYIGQTTRSILVRFKQHIYDSNSYSKTKYAIHNAIIKYGKENFIIYKICDCFTKNELNEMEAFYINKYQSLNKKNGYNLQIDNQAGTKSKETIQKIIKALTGKKRSKETREKMRMSNKSRTIEVRVKLSKQRIGEKNPFYGKKHKPETLLLYKNRGGINHPNYGKAMSEEQKKLILKREYENGNTKPIRMLHLSGEYIKDFISINEASRYLKSIGILTADSSAIGKAAKKIYNKMYGFIWEFI